MSSSAVMPQNLSWVKCLSGSQQAVQLRLSEVSMRTRTITTSTSTSTVIRMGGGPRTYPGGVSKWQWKRMQAKKAKQLLKARLCRERQIYEMRKRAELKAAVSELEKPWEVVERAPKLFSVTADDQLKALADRFQKPGAFDMWSDRDGPRLFQHQHQHQHGHGPPSPSARFFPKHVANSVKPYAGTSSNNNNKCHSPPPPSDTPGDGIRIGRFPTKSSTQKEEAPPPPPYEMSLRPDGRYEFQS
ncbi:hypothetical protein Sjap_011128 [Stephania japonica]|uniref:Uncharacterized protein n=1 Tax=Stephania japonica TaxID=461633 RepID=A0AAP0JAP6_9MAGN